MFIQPHFWCCCLVAAIFYRALDCASIRARAALLSLTSMLVLAAILKPWDLLALGLVVVWCWLMGNKLRVQRPQGIGAPLFTLLPIVVLWIVGKHDIGAVSSQHWLTFVGLSFVLVKCWTLLKDCADNRVVELDLETVCSYLTFFPCFVMGPMHTYNEFRTALASNSELSSKSLVDIYFRVALGLTKVYVVAPLLSPFSLLAVPGHQFSFSGLPAIVAGAFVYSIVIYCDFSGFSDLAISTARIIGVSTPENFASPYFSKSIRDFWNRWHMSFSRVLTSYVFIPLSRSLSTRFRNNRRLVMVVGYFVTFLICGYWHGPTINFLIWGIYHAIGLIAYDLYRSRRTKASPPKASSRISDMLCVALTFTFVSLGWIPFVLGGK